MEGHLSVREDSKLVIPLWLAVRLYPLKRSNDLKFEFPSAVYCNEVTCALSAEPLSVNLRKHSLSYFEVGMHMAFLHLRCAKDDGKRARSIIDELDSAQRSRWAEIVNHLGRGGLKRDPDALFVQKLTGWEEKIFFLIRDVESSLSAPWKNHDDARERCRKKIRRTGV